MQWRCRLLQCASPTLAACLVQARLRPLSTEVMTVTFTEFMAVTFHRGLLFDPGIDTLTWATLFELLARTPCCRR